MVAKTVSSQPTTEFAPEDLSSDSHIHYDVGYKIAFAEIASLFEDIQADLRIITDRGDDRSKGIYQRDADSVANNPANIAAVAQTYVNLKDTNMLDLINAEVSNPADLSNTSATNYNAIRNNSFDANGFQGGSNATRQSPGFGGNNTSITGNDDETYYENTIPLSQITPTSGTGSGKVKYSIGDIRNLPIQAQLFNILETAAQSAGVDVTISIGGQIPINEGGVDGKTRSGSNRYDKGYAAVVRLIDGDGTTLVTTNNDHLPVMIKFAQECQGAGATSIGMGNGYLENSSIHVDIAWTGQQQGIISSILPDRYWGGSPPSAENSPAYLSEIMGSRFN